jgi:Tfp pilus assembly protein PilF
MKFYPIIFLLLALGVCSCNTKEGVSTITNVLDYNTYLEEDQEKTLKSAENERDFWSKRLDLDSTGIGDLGPLAGAYTKIFEANGEVSDLKNAERLYKKAISIASPALKDAYMRSLAHNYMSQHKFKEANQLLEESYKGSSNKHATELMLFDSYMEIGAYEKAKAILENLKNETDYNYLIRVSKWSDHNGDLAAAIRYLERARDIAQSRNSTPLKIWTYSNIADYYGHDGNIKASYNHFLKTLALQPDNAYAKKGIAWILYSNEYNTKEANRIIDSLLVYRDIPDYYLLKAEFSEYDGDKTSSKKFKDIFISKAQNTHYGGMYNTYLIEALAVSNPVKALEIALVEIENRATPETYHLLALAQLKNGMKIEALQTIVEKVEGKTSEPMALLHSAMVYKANNIMDKVKLLKEELEGTTYELGPLLTDQVTKL